MAPAADEGRGKLRKAPGRRKRSLIRRSPNGATRLEQSSHPRMREEPGEVKHLSNPRKRNRRDSPSSGERNGKSLNQLSVKTAVVAFSGLWVSEEDSPQGVREVTNRLVSRNVLGKHAAEGESPVGESGKAPCLWNPSRPEHVKFRLKQGRPWSKAKYCRRPIEKQYREGKVKSTPGGE